MENWKIEAIFLGILVFLFYFVVFGILHGKTGLLVWTAIGIIAIFISNALAD